MGDVLLSAKEQAAYGLRAEGRTFAEVGEALGVAEQTARNYAHAAMKKGMAPLARRYDRRVHPKGGMMVPLDLTDPEAAAEAVVAGYTETKFDRDKFLANAQEAGIPPRMAVSLANRIASGYGKIAKDIKRLKVEEVILMLEDKIAMAGSYMDDAVMAAASAKDIAYILDLLIKNQRLLNERPTQIFDHNAHLELSEQLRLAMAEAARRGITIEQKAVVVVEEEPEK